MRLQGSGSDVVELLMDQEVAVRLRVSVSTLRRWRRGGIGPPWVRAVGGIRYHPADVAAWVEMNTHATVAGRRPAA